MIELTSLTPSSHPLQLKAGLTSNTPSAPTISPPPSHLCLSHLLFHSSNWIDVVHILDWIVVVHSSNWIVVVHSANWSDVVHSANWIAVVHSANWSDVVHSWIDQKWVTLLSMNLHGNKTIFYKIHLLYVILFYMLPYIILTLQIQIYICVYMYMNTCY
jgi:hypothetical protein